MCRSLIGGRKPVLSVMTGQKWRFSLYSIP